MIHASIFTLSVVTRPLEGALVATRCSSIRVLYCVEGTGIPWRFRFPQILTQRMRLKNTSQIYPCDCTFSYFKIGYIFLIFAFILFSFQLFVSFRRNNKPSAVIISKATPLNLSWPTVTALSRVLARRSYTS